MRYFPKVYTTVPKGSAGVLGSKGPMGELSSERIFSSKSDSYSPHLALPSAKTSGFGPDLKANRIFFFTC